MEQNKFDRNETMEMEQSGGIQKFDFWAKAVAAIAQGKPVVTLGYVL